MILEINGSETTLIAEDETDHGLLRKLEDRFGKCVLVEDTPLTSAALAIQADKGYIDGHKGTFITPEYAKRRMALQARIKEKDFEAVKDLAERFLELAIATTRSQPSPANYEVVGWDGGTRTWSHMTEGTKDYCIGWLKGVKAMKADWQHLRVVCGDVVVWPEELWGADAKLPPEEQE